MSRVFIAGAGAVSPAGWGREPLRALLRDGGAAPLVKIARPGWETGLDGRVVPKPSTPPAFLAHPRLRRSGPVTHYVVAAALEALGNPPAAAVQEGAGLGIILCELAGNVNYSRRFYQEVLSAPATASPMLFPETVFNAPASHLAAFLGADHPSYTLVGDDGAFLQGLVLAANWLEDGRAGACLVIGAEETDWIVADAVRLFGKGTVHGSGAGALLLTRSPMGAAGVELTAVTDSFSYAAGGNRREAARQMRSQLPVGGPDELLCWGVENGHSSDEPEKAAWADWKWDRLAPKAALGRAFTASAAWQCAAAFDAVARGDYRAANVSVCGVNQQAIGARFEKAGE